MIHALALFNGERVVAFGSRLVFDDPAESVRWIGRARARARA